jgi:hypothetical protein
VQSVASKVHLSIRTRTRLFAAERFAAMAIGWIARTRVGIPTGCQDLGNHAPRAASSPQPVALHQEQSRAEGQGHQFSPPIAANDFAELLARANPQVIYRRSSSCSVSGQLLSLP